MKWKLKFQVEVGMDVKLFCGNGYNVFVWVDVIVFGIVFNLYVIVGLEKDFNFGDNIYQVNCDKYDCSFWYCIIFCVFVDFIKELIWLNFNGVNCCVEVYLNGILLGKLDGFMYCGYFNVILIVNCDKENVLVVFVYMFDILLVNQGSLIYLFSGGWDWMFYVLGLNSGIIDKVFFINMGIVILIDFWICINLFICVRVDLSVVFDVKNNLVEKMKVLVCGIIILGNIVF